MQRSGKPLRTAGTGVVAVGGSRATASGRVGGREDPSAATTLRPNQGLAALENRASASGAPLGGGPETLEQQVQALKQSLERERSEVEALSKQLQELFMRNTCEDYLHKLERRLQVIENKEVDTIHWRVLDIEKVRSSCAKGEYVASPSFSACGLDGFSFHLYPRGDDFAEEGYCSLYFHVPPDTTVSRTLFIGRKQHGPLEADSLKNCGVSEMCVLSNEIDKETGSVIVGVEGLRVLKSPHVVETRTKISLQAAPRPAKQKKRSSSSSLGRGGLDAEDDEDEDEDEDREGEDEEESGR